MDVVFAKCVSKLTLVGKCDFATWGNVVVGEISVSFRVLKLTFVLYIHPHMFCTCGHHKFDVCWYDVPRLVLHMWWLCLPQASCISQA